MRGTKFRLGVCPCLWDPSNGLAASDRPRAFPAAGKSNVWDGFPLKNACCPIEKFTLGYNYQGLKDLCEAKRQACASAPVGTGTLCSLRNREEQLGNQAQTNRQCMF